MSLVRHGGKSAHTWRGGQGRRAISARNGPPLGAGRAVRATGACGHHLHESRPHSGLPFVFGTGPARVVIFGTSGNQISVGPHGRALAGSGARSHAAHARPAHCRSFPAPGAGAGIHPRPARYPGGAGGVVSQGKRYGHAGGICAYGAQTPDQLHVFQRSEHAPGHSHGTGRGGDHSEIHPPDFGRGVSGSGPRDHPTFDEGRERRGGQIPHRHPEAGAGGVHGYPALCTSAYRGRALRAGRDFLSGNHSEISVQPINRIRL